MSDHEEPGHDEEGGAMAPPSAPAAMPAEGLHPRLKRGQPLVPAGTIAGRALVTVVAILTFLAALTASGARLMADASSDWRSSVSREFTVQVRPRGGQDIEALVERAAALVRAAPGVDSVRSFSKSEAEQMLAPWLGTGLDLVELPIPRLIVAQRADGAEVDLAKLRAAIAEAVPGASLDDHSVWLKRLSAMANGVIVVGLSIVLLVLTAAALAIGFATRGALAGAKDIVEVLHFVGADNRYIARQFQARFLRFGLKGGLIGGGLAALFLFGVGALASAMRASPGGNEIEALFGSFRIGLSGYGAILAVVVLVTLVTALVSRETVRRQLKTLY